VKNHTMTEAERAEFIRQANEPLPPAIRPAGWSKHKGEWIEIGGDCEVKITPPPLPPQISMFEIPAKLAELERVTAERDEWRNKHEELFRDRAEVLLLNADQAIDNTKMREQRDASAAALDAWLHLEGHHIADGGGSNCNECRHAAGVIGVFRHGKSINCGAEEISAILTALKKQVRREALEEAFTKAILKAEDLDRIAKSEGGMTQGHGARCIAELLKLMSEDCA